MLKEPIAASKKILPFSAVFSSGGAEAAQILDVALFHQWIRQAIEAVRFRYHMTTRPTLTHDDRLWIPGRLDLGAWQGLPWILAYFERRDRERICDVIETDIASLVRRMLLVTHIALLRLTPARVAV